MAQIYDTSEQLCECGSGVLTRLRCSRCGRPICPHCMVSSPVGYRCQQCAAGRPNPMYQTSTPLFYAEGDDGKLYIAASFAGSGTEPHWYRNLLVHPEVVVETAREKRRCRARTVGADGSPPVQS